MDLIRSEEVTAPGLYRMSEAAYHADPAPAPSLSRSIAEKLLLESPLHARAAHPRLTKQDPTEEKNSRTREIGSAGHALLLRQPTEIAVLDYDDFKSKAAQADRAAAQARGAIPMLTVDYEKSVAMVGKARALLSKNDHPAIRALADGDDAAMNEVTAVWKDRCGDLWARARMDRIHIIDGRLTILDYKTTELSVEPAAVAAAVYNKNLHFQDAFYRRAARALFPEIDRHELKLDFIFVMQEQDPPFEITVARVDAAGRLIGEKMVSDAFLLWRKCMSDNWWPGYPDGIVEAEMPAYVDTRWTSREIEHPYLQGLGYDPMPMFESRPYHSKPIMEPN
ncbi:PD-(D/E)XK nuclease family protein [Rhizobium leguminosarum]|uniref:PD-(D/E)XK nuclease family protein n=1 Tax=Rhizobium leguminosarum TaxID=384 RepID=UPI001FE02AA0|nr:PD-(D/E)XK nuclease family protein [Rhizobium leguminosarum]